MSRNLCIHHHDPCNPRLILDVGHVNFKDTIINRNKSKKEPTAVSKYIAD